MLFINTRPATRAQPLSQYLQQHGIRVMALPLLALVETPLQADERQALQAIDDQQVIVLVSEEAVIYGLAQLASVRDLSKVSHALTWVAVGAKTAACFARTWQRHSEVPPPRVIFPAQGAQQNNEGLLQLQALRALQPNNRVQIWRGVGGRELVADTLKDAGVSVQLLNFYQRLLPTSSIDQFGHWQAQGLPAGPRVVLISSLSAWQHWCQLLQRYSMANTCFTYLVLQSRIAKHIEAQSASRPIVKVIDDLQPATVLHALAQWIDQER